MKTKTVDGLIVLTKSKRRLPLDRGSIIVLTLAELKALYDSARAARKRFAKDGFFKHLSPDVSLFVVDPKSSMIKALAKATKEAKGKAK